MTEAIQTRLADQATELSDDIRRVEAWEIQTQTDVDMAAAAIKGMSLKRKALEAERMEVTKPINDSLKRIRAWFKPVEEGCQRVEILLKTKVAAFEQRMADQNRLALLEAQTAAAEQLDPHAITAALDKIVHVDKPAEITFREVWDFEVEDLKAVPWELLKVEVRRKDILARLRDGQQVPGVRGFKRKDVAVGR